MILVWRARRSRARRAGADAVLVKPCAPEKLLAEIHRVMNVPPSRKAI